MSTPAEPAPAQPSTLPTRAGRQPRPPRSRRGPMLMLGGAALLFVGLALWLATRTLPYVTRGEALALAVAIEETKSLERLRSFCEFRMPPGVSPEEAARFGLPDPVQVLADAKQGSYTFVSVLGAGDRRPVLLFRSSKDDVLLDYHELRVDRIGDAVKVTDLWSMLADSSHRERLEEYPRLVAEPALATLHAPADAAKALAAFRALPPELRSSRIAWFLLATPQLRADPVTTSAAEVDFRALHPYGLAADLLLLSRTQQHLKTRLDPPTEIAEAFAALNRILDRTGDEKYAEAWGRHLRK